MYMLAQVIHTLFPLAALILLIYGIKSRHTIAVTSALWISLITLSIHYQVSGSEIFGSYFNFKNAAIYTLNIVVLVASLIALLSLSTIKTMTINTLNNLLKSLLVLGSLLLIINVWMNAYFIENRLINTPVMQVANLNTQNYCHYPYVFYKISKNGSLDYLCPNAYGLIPKIGKLTFIPEAIAHYLPRPVLKNMLKQSKKNH